MIKKLKKGKYKLDSLFYLRFKPKKKGRKLDTLVIGNDLQCGTFLHLDYDKKTKEIIGLEVMEEATLEMI